MRQSFDCASRRQIKNQIGLPFLLQFVAQSGGVRIDKTTFDTTARNHKLALCCACLAGDRHRLDWLACEAFGKDVTPIDIETAIGRTHRCNLDILLREYFAPYAIGAELGPACATEGKKGCVARYRFNSVWRLNQWLARAEADPFMTGQYFDALRFQSTYPCTQQRRSLHRFRENTTG
ncbi:hypothetical protein D3C80_589300 [compost metagenome]